MSDRYKVIKQFRYFRTWYVVIDDTHSYREIIESTDEASIRDVAIRLNGTDDRDNVEKALRHEAHEASEIIVKIADIVDQWTYGNNGDIV